MPSPIIQTWAKHTCTASSCKLWACMRPTFLVLLVKKMLLPSSKHAFAWFYCKQMLLSLEAKIWQVRYLQNLWVVKSWCIYFILSIPKRRVMHMYKNAYSFQNAVYWSTYFFVSNQIRLGYHDSILLLGLKETWNIHPASKHKLGSRWLLTPTSPNRSLCNQSLH